MRSAFFLALCVAPALLGLDGPVDAQTCEGSAIGKAGEVFVTAGSGRETATWIVERVEGEGIETDNFPRPALMLDFEFTDGELSGPYAAVVPISRISSEAVGRAPELDVVWVEARLDDRVVSWRASDVGKGERALAEALTKLWPANLLVTLQEGRHGGVALASAAFPLSLRPEAQALARAALAARICPAN